MARHYYSGIDYSLAVRFPRKGFCSEATPEDADSSRLSAGSCPAAGAKSPSLEEDLGGTSEGSTTQCMPYLFVNFFFVNNSFNSAFLSLATEGILTDIITKHFLKFRTVRIQKGLPWEVMSSLSPAVVR